MRYLSFNCLNEIVGYASFLIFKKRIQIAGNIFGTVANNFILTSTVAFELKVVLSNIKKVRQMNFKIQTLDTD